MTKTNDPEMERYTQDLWDTIMRIIQSFRSGMGTWEEIGLTFPQSMLLLVLQREGRISMGELSQGLRVTQSVATRMVDLLLEKGLVERSRDESDRRMVMVALSAEGANVAQQFEEYNQRKIGEALAAVPARERDDLLRLLKRLQLQFEREEMD